MGGDVGSGPLEEDFLVVTGTVADVDDFYGILPNAVEDQVVAVHATSDAVALVARHERVPLGQIREALAVVEQLLGKARGSLWVVGPDLLVDCEEATLRRIRDDDLHGRSGSSARGALPRPRTDLVNGVHAPDIGVRNPTRDRLVEHREASVALEPAAKRLADHFAVRSVGAASHLVAHDLRQLGG